jgi:hypothetical protein
MSDVREVGVDRWYIVTGTMDEAWFRTFSAFLREKNSEIRNADLSVRPNDDSGDRLRFPTFEAWSDYIAQHGPESCECYFWIPSGSIPHAQCDRQRAQVNFTFAVADENQIEQLKNEAEQRLQLEPLKPGPYRYRRTSVEYEIGNWDPELFVAGIRRLAAMLGGRPSLMDAYLKKNDGKIEELLPFYDLEPFLTAIGKSPSRFTEAVLTMAARGNAIGLMVMSDQKRLRIRTTLEADELNTIETAWSKEMKLKLTKASDYGQGLSGSSPPPPESLLLKYGIQVLITLLTLGAVSLTAFKKAIWPDYSVVITSPGGLSGTADFEPGQIPVSWYEKPEQVSLRSDHRVTPAQVTVFGKNGVVTQLAGSLPTMVTVNNEGQYTLVVDPGDAAPAQVPFRVTAHRGTNSAGH